jgi:outer membrane protein TolC
MPSATPWVVASLTLILPLSTIAANSVGEHTELFENRLRCNKPSVRRALCSFPLARLGSAMGVVLSLAVSLSGCEQTGPESDAALVAYTARMETPRADDASAGGRTLTVAATQEEEPSLVKPLPGSDLEPQRVLLGGPPAQNQPAAEAVLLEIPDPMRADEVLRARLERIEEEAFDRRVVVVYRDVFETTLEFIHDIMRKEMLELSLEDAIQRALRHNYSIRAASFNPAIEGTRLVEARAAFDAEFFLDASLTSQDRASFDRPAIGDQAENRQIAGGIRKLLPTGMAAEFRTSFNRAYIDSPDVPRGTNPVYTTNIVTSLRQPLLRGFGIEVNRAQIEIARANRDVSYWQFVREIRDRLLDVERAYWRLVQARRAAVVQAESVAQTFVTYKNFRAREDIDATPVQIQNSEARYKSRLVDLQQRIKDILDAEDVLKNLINDPDLLLSETNVAIVPTTLPLVMPVTVDHFAEVRTAIDSRSEIKEARKSIEAARIQTFVAKNQTLPQLDLSFEYDIEGVGVAADNSWDQATGADFRSYTIAVNFAYPIGNRGPEAAHRRARLQEQQLVVRLRQVIDAVVQEVNTTVRDIFLRYAQVPPQFEAVQASERNLRSLQARATETSPSFLETELNGVDQLANNRLTLLNVLVEYNIALATLERDKGTLLEYNNVVLIDDEPFE